MSKGLKAYYIVPLYNVNYSGMNEKILPRGYKLIKNTEFFDKYRPQLMENIYTLEEDVQIPRVGTFHRRTTATYLLIKEIQIKPTISDKGFNHNINDELYDQEEIEITNWVFALRLLNAGNIQVSKSYCITDHSYADFHLSVGTIIPNLSNSWRFPQGEYGFLDNYSLDNLEPNSMISMIVKCEENYPALQIPLNYWSSYYQERNLINKILRLATIWEVTLLNDKKTELQYALKLRGSYLLHKDVSKVLQLAYSIRSEIVHTGTLTQNTINKVQSYINKSCKDYWFAVFLFIKQELEPLTREILCAFLNRIDGSHLTLEKIAKQLDEEIIAGFSKNIN